MGIIKTGQQYQYTRPRVPSPSGASRVVGLSQAVCWTCRRDLAEAGNGDRSPSGAFLAIPFDPLQLVEGCSCQVAFSAIRTGNHRYSLNHEQVAATTITPRYAPLPGSFFTANIADHRLLNCHGWTLYTVIITRQQLSSETNRVSIDAFAVYHILPFSSLAISLAFNNFTVQHSALQVKNR